MLVKINIPHLNDYQQHAKMLIIFGQVLLHIQHIYTFIEKREAKKLPGLKRNIIGFRSKQHPAMGKKGKFWFTMVYP